MKKTKNRAITVAEALLCLARDHGESLDPLKLQKLLYFAQAISLVRNDRPMFKDAIGAWSHGPVVQSVYKKYQDYGRKPIACEIDDGNFELTKEDVAVLEDTLETFKKYTGVQLRNITHKHLPWKEVFKEDRNYTIKNNRIKKYYTGVFS